MLPGWQHPTLRHPKTCRAARTPERGARSPPTPHPHPFCPSHPSPRTQHPPAAPSTLPTSRATSLLSSFLWFRLGRGGVRVPRSRPPPTQAPGSPRPPPAQHPQHPASPRPPSSLGSPAPAGLFSNNFLSFSLSSFSLWFLFFIFFFFLIPSVFFFSLPFDKNPNGNIHFHFLLSRSRDEGEGRAMKRASFPPPRLVLVSHGFFSFPL